MKRTILAAILAMSLAGCSSDSERVAAYLPYFGECEHGIESLRTLLSGANYDTTLEVLSPSVQLVRGQIFSNYLKVEYAAENEDKAFQAILNNFMFDCSPSGMIELQSKTISEQNIRNLLRNQAPGYRQEGGFHLEVKGDSLRIYFVDGT